MYQQQIHKLHLEHKIQPMFVFNTKATIKTSWNQLQKNEPKMKYN
jgi:sensor histidine kinase YesM